MGVGGIHDTSLLGCGRDFETISQLNISGYLVIFIVIIIFF